MMRSKQLLILTLCLMLTAGCSFFSRDAAEKDFGQEKIDAAAETAEKTDPYADLTAAELFEEGYEQFEDQDYEDAATIFYRYQQVSTPDDADYQWAEFFFGVSLKRMGYSQAASDILARLVVRKPNPKIVSYSLEMFEVMSRTQPIDHDLIIDEVICDQSFGFVEGKLADFVNYYQGLYDWRHGFYDWGNDHFKRITPKSYYYYLYIYQRALRHVHDDDIDSAISDLKLILKNDLAYDRLKIRAKKNLARLLYEKDEFFLADQMYRNIERSVLKQSETLLERAWAHYRMGDAEKAMGLLYAFEAPSFEIYFTPEYYLLKSFIYKDVCHYRRALRVVDEFRERYKSALENIYSRGEMTENKNLLLLLLHKENIRETWQLLNLLTEENKSLEQFVENGGDPELADFLKRMYALQIDESRNKLRLQMTAAYENYANELLKYEEEANLMAYEIGLDMYQRVHQYHYKDEEAVSKQPAEQAKVVVYPFQNEFWDDELADYHVELRNKCNEAEEWDIFFK